MAVLEQKTKNQTQVVMDLPEINPDFATTHKNEQTHEQSDKIARIIDNVHVSIVYKNDAEPITDEEIRAYILRGNKRNPNTVVSALDLVLDGDEVEIHYDLAPVPFDRIRRITGYLVGTMDRWNDAKTSEEKDRVKHGIVA